MNVMEPTENSVAPGEKLYATDRHGSAFEPNDRLKQLIDRRDWLTQNHKKDLLCDNAEFLIYHWSGKSEIIG